MKKTNRILSLTLAALTTVGMFAGCKKEQKTELPSDGPYTPTNQLQLTIWETQGTDYSPTEQPKENLVENWLEEKTLVEIKNIYGNDGGQWDSKLSKLVAGNTLPHIVHCGGYQGPAHFAKLNQLGQVWELTPEMLQKYAPELWKRTPSKYWEQMKVDGKILGIPYGFPESREIYTNATDEEYEFIANLKPRNVTDVTYQPNDCFWIRDDILKDIYPEAKSYDELCKALEEKGAPLEDELLDIPIKSTEEFVDFLYKIKEKGYKEHDKTVYAFGYNGGDNWVGLSWFGADMCGYKNHNYASTWNKNTQRIEIPIAHDVIKEAAKLENQMINDNVIDPESLAHTLSQYREKVYNGQYAIIAPSYVGSTTTINKQLEADGKNFRFRPFITQIPAQKDYPAYKEEASWANSICLLKTLSEEQVAQVLNWINTQYTDEFEQVRYWGPKEAGLYTETEDGKRQFTDERFTKYFIENDATALPTVDDRKGLGTYGCEMAVLPTTGVGKWAPEVMYRVKKLTPAMGSGFCFTAESEHVKDVVTYPPCQIWSSVYAEVPEVVEFWGARDQWESKFRMALAADKNDFDSKWSDAVDNLNDIVKIEDLEEAMTKIAKPLAENIK